ncbi:hypothetical protein GCM10029978_051320 [Actinoallomurus acanthiterrae]
MKIRHRSAALAVLALSLSVLGTLAPTQAMAVGCVEGKCTGLNPDTEGCGADAWTTTTVFAVGGGRWVDLRHSAKCNAVWARSDDSTWDFSIQAANSKGGTPVRSYTNGGGYYTLMIGFNYWVRACIRPAGYPSDQSTWTCSDWY